MALDVQELNRLSGQIQNAALEPALSEPLLESISSAIGALGISIMQPLGGSIDGVLVTSSLSEAIDAYVREEWDLRDHRAQFIPMFHRLGVTLEDDFAHQSWYTKLDYYKFMAKFHMRHSAVLDLSTSQLSPRFFVIQNHIENGPFSTSDVEHFQALRMQLLAAARFKSMLLDCQLGGMSTAFERASIACVMIGGDGRIVRINGTAERLVASGDLKIVSQQIHPQAPQDGLILSQALHEALRAGGKQINPIALRRFGKRPLLARVEPAFSHIRDIFSSAHAVILFEDAEVSASHSAEVLTALFGLTPTECTVTALIAEGYDATEISRRCDIAYETARTHIRSIFRKTGAARQAELVSILARLKLR